MAHKAVLKRKSVDDETLPAAIYDAKYLLLLSVLSLAVMAFMKAIYTTIVPRYLLVLIMAVIIFAKKDLILVKLKGIKNK